MRLVLYDQLLKSSFEPSVGVQVLTRL